MRLDFTLVHRSPLVNSYKGRDYFSAFVFYSANLKDATDTERRVVPPALVALRVYPPDGKHKVIVNSEALDSFKNVNVIVGRLLSSSIRSSAAAKVFVSVIVIVK